jgi:hypothetical protein
LKNIWAFDPCRYQNPITDPLFTTKLKYLLPSCENLEKFALNGPVDDVCHREQPIGKEPLAFICKHSTEARVLYLLLTTNAILYGAFFKVDRSAEGKEIPYFLFDDNHVFSIEHVEAAVSLSWEQHTGYLFYKSSRYTSDVVLVLHSSGVIYYYEYYIIIIIGFY